MSRTQILDDVGEPPAILEAPKPPHHFPPYPSHSEEPPTVAGEVDRGNEVRRTEKNKRHKSIRKPPRMAKPGGPKVPLSVHMTPSRLLAHLRCLEVNGAVPSDRLEEMARPQHRLVLGLWREHAGSLPAHVIDRFRNLLHADEPFDPDQAYAYFANLRNRARNKNAKSKRGPRGCGDRQQQWLRRACLALARGVRLRLATPGVYHLRGSKLRLADIVLRDVSRSLKVRTPSRNTKCKKDKFFVEMSDKITVLIYDILTEAEDRMLMMDVDEDAELAEYYKETEDSIYPTCLCDMGLWPAGYTLKDPCSMHDTDFNEQQVPSTEVPSTEVLSTEVPSTEVPATEVPPTTQPGDIVEIEYSVKILKPDEPAPPTEDETKKESKEPS